MAQEDSTTLSSTCHRENLQLRTAALQPTGRGPPAITMCFICDIASHLPSLGGTKGSAYLQQWPSSRPLSRLQLCSLSLLQAHPDLLGKQKWQVTFSAAGEEQGLGETKKTSINGR